MRTLFVILFTIVLAGCFGGGEVIPQDQFYHLADISGQIPKINKPLGVVAVSPLQSDALHRERTILYAEQATPLQLNRYHYHHWTNMPGQLIQEHLITYLREVGIANDVIRYGEQSRIDAQISGYIHRFERILGEGNPKIAIRLELSFNPRTPGRQMTVTRVYSLEQETADTSMHASVAAFSQGLQDIYSRFVADIAL